jgi:hypothetical protein
MITKILVFFTVLSGFTFEGQRAAQREAVRELFGPGEVAKKLVTAVMVGLLITFYYHRQHVEVNG